MNQQSNRPTPPKQPRPLILALMLTGVLFWDANFNNTNSARASPDPIHIARKLVKNTSTILKYYKEVIHLDLAVGEAVFADLSEKTGLPPEQFEITDRQKRVWPDRCLGLGSNPSLCPSEAVEGWRLEISHRWIYRTDLLGRAIALENPEASKPSAETDDRPEKEGAK